MSSASRPANLKAGLAADEVQEVSVEGGSGTFTLTVTTATGLAAGGSSVLTEVEAGEGAFHVGDTLTMPPSHGQFAANTTVLAVGANTLTISTVPPFNATTGNRLEASETTAAIHAGASAAEVEAALVALPGVGAGNVEVTGPAGGPYLVSFQGSLADLPVATMRAGGSAPVHVSEVTHGRSDGEIVVTVENMGDAVLKGEMTPLTISDNLPPGLHAVGIVGKSPGFTANFQNPQGISCSLGSLSCTFDRELAPYDELEIRIAVRVSPDASSTEANDVSVSGGGAPTTSFSRPIRISDEPSHYGVEDWRLRAEEEGGALATQAGSHPFQVTGTVMINQGPETGPLSEIKPVVEPVALSKDIITKIPAGLIGNPVPIPRCTLTQFITEANFREDECPANTAIGVVSVTVYEPATVGYVDLAVPLFNLEPYYGEPARFGFFVDKANVPVVLDTSLRDGPGEDYGVNVTSTNISQLAGLTGVRVTFWGVPNDPRHDNSRGWD
ncbi:MAG: hypothetical protein WAN93_01775, partial [Solirubrobacteraceae bacterium]